MSLFAFLFSFSLSLKKLELFPVQDFRKKNKISEYMDLHITKTNVITDPIH